MIIINLSNNILKIDIKEFPTVSKLIILGEEKERILKQIKKLMKLKENDNIPNSEIFVLEDREPVKKKLLHPTPQF